MNNNYVEPKLEIKSFGIRENINNTQDTEDLSALWPMSDDENDSAEGQG